MEVLSILKEALRVIAWVPGTMLVLTILHFPYGVDGPPQAAPLVEEEAEDFYQTAYERTSEGGDSLYVEVAQAYAHDGDVIPNLEAFVAKYGLEDARTLEVGAGSGTLQDVVEDYVGLDIAASAQRYFHKPFVQGSATDLPFEDNEFGDVWTIWTLEHVPNPESAMNELRRVTKDGGYIYFGPAWNNPTWAPMGYMSRGFSDLGLYHWLIKMTLYVREIGQFKGMYRYPTRLLRWGAASLGGPTRLHYRHVDGNFEKYWMADSDAVNSIDCFEAQLWFESRGDEVLNTGTPWNELYTTCREPLLVRVHKD
jgi:SAM-dependent methyltransferase